ncbi:MAG TPA: ribonuclease III [Acidimicrobiia bacterium]|nr:ribonuclease III [Acidimicrobiia bacterium]
MSLESRIGYSFTEPRLLRLALTHRSVSSENPARNDNERLEFLGDAVLQLVVTDLLYDGYPQLAEGQMAKVRAAVVSRGTLAEIARRLELGVDVELATSEEATGGRDKDSILSDAVEAVIGAIYLDGGLEPARSMIALLWSDHIAERAKQPGVKDYKTRLQELAARGGQRPVYQVAGSGPDHDRRFHAEVAIAGRVLGAGVGRSKKEAEQEAAREALSSLSPSSR